MVQTLDCEIAMTIASNVSGENGGYRAFDGRSNAKRLLALDSTLDRGCRLKAKRLSRWLRHPLSTNPTVA